MKNFFSEFDLRKYDRIEDLEKAREYFVRMYDRMTSKLISGKSVDAEEYEKIKNTIDQFGMEIDRRRYGSIHFSEPKGRCAVAMMSSENYNQISPYYQSHTHTHPYLDTPMPQSYENYTYTPTIFESPDYLKHEIDALKEQLVGNNKQINELRRDNENLTKELEHEQIQSDNSRRIIEWLTEQRGSFYKSDVEKDDE